MAVLDEILLHLRRADPVWRDGKPAPGLPWVFYPPFQKPATRIRPWMAWAAVLTQANHTNPSPPVKITAISEGAERAKADEMWQKCEAALKTVLLDLGRARMAPLPTKEAGA